MGLPKTRNENYVDGGLPKIKAATLNALQDLWGSLTTGTSTLFSGGVSLLCMVLDGDGGNVVTIPGTGALRPRIYVPDEPTVRTLFYQAKLTTTVYLRRYILDNGGVEETINAKWNPASSLWTPDDGSHVASSDRIVGTSTVATTYKYKKNAGTASWADGAWDEVFSVDRLGHLTVLGNVKGARHFVSGTATAAGDWTPSAEWGTTAVVNSASGYDGAGFVKVTSNGMGITLDPELTITFKDGTWTNAPTATAVISDTDDVNCPAGVKVTATATTLKIKMRGTPAAGKFYQYSYQVTGL